VTYLFIIVNLQGFHVLLQAFELGSEDSSDAVCTHSIANINKYFIFTLSMEGYIRTALEKHQSFRTTEMTTFAVKLHLLQPFPWEINILAKVRRLKIQTLY